MNAPPLHSKTGSDKHPLLCFHNTLSNSLETFSPHSNNEVLMYNCGPTVYGSQHIGNMRAAVVADLLRRTLFAWGYTVKQVINITDFGHLSSDADEGEDKMTMGLKREGMELTIANMRVLAEKYTEEYFKDIESLGVPLDSIIFPRASDYIAEQISLIMALEEKGYAYTTEQGVYYDVSHFSAYGKLGNINLAGLREGARIQENAHKRGPFDFILWKSDKHLGWNSPWGLGFPGWHIECTSMIFKLLGQQIDIHTGGIEHIPVHHNNEIAQAEAVSGKPFATYWLHNDHITIGGKKIAKSLGNTVYLTDIVKRGISPFALRYWFLTAHYRSPANFTWEALEGARTALTRLSRMYQEYKIEAKSVSTDSAFENSFFSALGHDLDTPRALALLWDYMKNANITAEQKFAALLTVDLTLGLGFSAGTLAEPFTVIDIDSLPDAVQSLLAAREEARQSKDFMKADELRSNIYDLGYEVQDTARGISVTART